MRKQLRLDPAGLALLVGVSAPALVASPVAGQAGERVVLPGPSVAVHNVAGRVRVQPGTGSEVVVSVTRGGPDASRLRLDRRRIAGAEALVIVYPGDRVVYPAIGRGSESRIRVAEDGVLYGESNRRITVSGSGRGTEAWADLTISVPSGVDLAIHLGAGATEARDIEANLLIDVASGTVDVSAHAGALSVDTGSGAVSVSGVRGDLRVDTGSGAVEARDVTGDLVLIDTGSGRVTASGVEASELRIDTGSGRISVSGASADDIVLDTGSGRIEVELLRRVDTLEIDTGSGGVVVYVPSDLGAEIEIDTGSGGIDVDFPITVYEAERDYLRGRIGDGGGRILIDTGSGSVRLIRR